MPFPSAAGPPSAPESRSISKALQIAGASAWLMCIAVAPVALAGEAPAAETRGVVERALEAARSGDAARAAQLARDVFSGEAKGADDEAEREVRRALEKGVAELERVLGADDPRVRASAAWALGWIAHRPAGARLAGMLADSERAVRIEAARALGRLGSRKYKNVILRLAADEDASMRAAALESLGLMGSSWSAGVTGLSDVSPKVRLAAAGLLARVAPDAPPLPAAARALVRALGDDSRVVRVCVATTLGRIGDKAAVEPLKRAAMDEDDMVSGAAVEALGDIGEPAAEALVEIAEAALSAGDAGTVTAARAARALGRTGARATLIVEALGRLVDGGPPDVAKAAVGALGSIGGEGARRILAGATDRPEVRVEVAVAAARLGEFAPSRLLLADLSDDDPWVRLAAARGLADIGNPVGIPVFIDALESDDDEARNYAGACLAVYARADINCWEARPGERGKLANAWRRWWLENRETLVVPDVRAEAADRRPRVRR